MNAAKPLNQAKVRRAIFVGLAFLLQGGWAYYVALEHSLTTKLRSGLLHGTLCALATVMSTLLMEILFRQGGRGWRGYAVAVLGTAVVMIGGTSIIHWLSKTPDILATIAPLAAIGLPFYAFYSYLIWRSESNRGD